MKKRHVLEMITLAVFVCFGSTVWGADMGQINSGETKTGYLSLPPSENSENSWTFNGDAGDQVLITAARIIGTVQPQIFLYPPDNSGLEESATDFTYAQTLDHKLLKTGLYTVVIRDNGMDGEGEYGIALAKMPGAATSPGDLDGGAIASGETRTGSLTDNADTDIFQFYGDAGDQVLITAARIIDTVQPQIFLYPPDNSGLEESATDFTYAQTLDHKLLKTGLYTVVIRDNGMDGEGEYGIALAKMPGAATSPGDLDGGAIASGETRTGSLTDNADTDIFQFYGDAGDQVLITAARIIDTVQPQIFLYPPDNSGLEESATDFTYAQTLDHKLLKTGLYTVVIRDNGMNGEGEYGIALAKMPGAATSPGDLDGGAIASGETRIGSLTDNADTDIFQFYGDAGNQVFITAARIIGTVQPQIFLYPPDNSGLEESATAYTYDQTLNHQLLKTGLYTVVIRDNGMNGEGEFSISFSKTPPEKSLGIYNPFPPEGSSVDVTCGDFSWDAVVGATGYDIYFGENVIEPTVLIGENLPTSSMPFPDILPFTVYYWHVLAHTAGEDVQGPVWWFETDGCFGDFDKDNDVDGKDLSVFVASMLTYNADADFDNDDVIDDKDLVRFLCNFGKTECVYPVAGFSHD